MAVVAAGTVAAFGMWALLTKPPPPALTVEHASDTATGPIPTGALTTRTPCGDARLAMRPYGEVVLGSRMEALSADAGQLIVIAADDEVRSLRVTAERKRGAGQLLFQDGGRRVRTAVLDAAAHRTAEGWPPHWGLPAVMTGPGCWHLHIRGGGVDERLVYSVNASQWRRSWRWTLRMSN